MRTGPSLCRNSVLLAIALGALAGSLVTYGALVPPEARLWVVAMLVAALVLPALALGPWRRVLDTSYDPPQDLHAVRHVQDIDAAPLAHGSHYRVQGRSVVALFVRVRPGVQPES